MNQNRRRAVAMFAAMAATSVAGFGVGAARRADGRPALSLRDAIPEQFAGWTIDPVAAAFVRAPGELETRLYQQLLERTYVDPAGRRVMLSTAYGRDQSAGLELHWPEVCYRFGGYSVHSNHKAIVRAAGEPLEVARLVAELPQRPEPMTYWAVLGGRQTPDATTFRLQRLAHAVQREPADGLLVRVSSIDPLTARAFELQARFIDDLARALADDVRPRIFGRPPEG